MTKLVFATGNKHKFEEVRAEVPQPFSLLSLSDLSFNEEIPETEITLQGNALLKARHIHERYKFDCFSDDTGLEIDALNGAPGVYSARYAGENATFAQNMQKVLQQMKGTENRNARFRCVFALILNGQEHLFEGTTEGKITEQPIGEDGFGYDPIFRPTGFSKTFAQMTMAQKNSISHRGRALEKMKAFLQKHLGRN